MKEMFPGYFANNSEGLKSIWDECLFVLDANVLLNLYRYSDSTSSELIEIFRLLSDRLWVPHQVAKEYLSNRVAAISQQVKVYDDAMKGVGDLRKAFENPKQHPFISEDAMSCFLKAEKQIISELSGSKKGYLSRVEKDDIKDRLEVLLEGRVGGGMSTEDASDMIADGQERYAQKIPPGYKDGKKGGDSEILEDKLKPYGDLIVWKQTLKKAKADGRSVIFVTGDSKEDWWTIFSGKPLEPHPQLVEEFLRDVGRGFYMYLPEVFMEKANEYLERITSRRAVEEIVIAREEEDTQNSARISLESPPGLNRYMAEDGREYYASNPFNLVDQISVINDEMESLAEMISMLEFKVKKITREQDELLARQSVSLQGTSGVDSPHSLALKRRIRNAAGMLNELRQDLSDAQSTRMNLAKRKHELSVLMQEFI